MLPNVQVMFFTLSLQPPCKHLFFFLLCPIWWPYSCYLGVLLMPIHPLQQPNSPSYPALPLGCFSHILFASQLSDPSWHLFVPSPFSTHPHLSPAHKRNTEESSDKKASKGCSMRSLRFLSCLCCVTLGQPLYFWGSQFPPYTIRHIQLNKHGDNSTQLLKQTTWFWKFKKEKFSKQFHYPIFLTILSYLPHHAKIMSTIWWVLLLLF